MPVFKHTTRFNINDGDAAVLKIELPDTGSDGTHFIDIPGPEDKRASGDCTVPLGVGVDLKRERTLILSKPFNINGAVNEIRVNYYINDQLIQEHSNAKTDDTSPQVVVSITFV